MGMANALIKRLVLKVISVKDAPSRRYSYYITPEGFMEKGRLVSKYVANYLSFLVKRDIDYDVIACQISAGQVTKSAVSELEGHEIAQMVFATHNIEVVCS